MYLKLTLNVTHNLSTLFTSGVGAPEDDSTTRRNTAIIGAVVGVIVFSLVGIGILVCLCLYIKRLIFKLDIDRSPLDLLHCFCISGTTG